MLERVQERLIFNLGGNVRADIYRLPRKRAYVCRVTFPNGDVVDSISARLSWTTVEGAKAWAASVVAQRGAADGE